MNLYYFINQFIMKLIFYLIEIQDLQVKYYDGVLRLSLVSIFPLNTTITAFAILSEC